MGIEQGRDLMGRAKERLSAFNAIAVFRIAHYELNRLPNEGLDWLQRVPFIWLLFCKWAFSSWRPNDDRPNPTAEDISFVTQTTWDAFGHLMAADGRPEIFMRRMTLQQLWLQRDFDTSAIPRQYRILAELMADSKSAACFRQQFGLTPADFAVISMHMAADAGDILGKSGLSSLRPTTPRDSGYWTAARRILDRTLPQLHREACELRDRGTLAEVEICEQSPLVRTPFVTFPGSEPMCIHPILMFRMLETVLFDLSRAIHPRRFMNEFGPAFAAFLGEVLDDLSAHVVGETELMRRLTGNGRVVDYAIISDDALVLVEAKGIEGHYDELYHNLPRELATRLRTSLLRAVDQAISTVNRLPVELKRPEVYFLCVTFKQVAVTDGSALRELTVGTDEWEDSRWKSRMLPPERMLFPSVKEFESIVALANSLHQPLNRVLQEMVQANSNPASRRQLLEQHVAERSSRLDAPLVIQHAANRARV